MWPQLDIEGLDSLHRHVVSEVMTHVLGLGNVGQQTVPEAIDGWFSRFPEDVRELLVHDDPLMIALEISGVDDRRTAVARQRDLRLAAADVAGRAQADWFNRRIEGFRASD